MSIADLKKLLQQLHAERARVIASGLTADDEYLTDLAAELERMPARVHLHGRNGAHFPVRRARPLRGSILAPTGDGAPVAR